MFNAPFNNLLLIDIETVSQCKNFDELSPTWKNLWETKAAHQLPENETAANFYTQRAAIFAEFGKIVCASIGYFKLEGDDWQLRVKSFFSHDEKELLIEILQAIMRWQQSKKEIIFCGHNIKEFDMPYLCRRLLVNGLDIPRCMDFQNMKPWDVNMMDTLQLWKFGDYKHYISLNLLAACMGILSPKDDIDGSMVGQVYWQENDLPRIAAYCQKDVVTVAQLMLRFAQKQLLTDEDITIVS